MEENKYLGQQGSYAVQTDKFDPNFLVPMSRSTTREGYGITGSEFVGYDVWHCHESTFLLDNGLPLSGTLKIAYPSDSEYMVESKSFKLYLNSFDMCKMGKTIEDAISNYERQIIKDVSKVLLSAVQVKFFESKGNLERDEIDPSIGYSDLYEAIGFATLESLEISDYTCSVNHLNFIPIINQEGERRYRLSTSVLRSRCRHTKQKDTGNAFFDIILKKGFDLDVVSLLKQVISLRNLDEFHEFCSERLYIDLMNSGKVKDCSVMLLYARRGSLDINPIRASSPGMINWGLVNIDQLTTKQQNQ